MIRGLTATTLCVLSLTGCDTYETSVEIYEFYSCQELIGRAKPDPATFNAEFNTQTFEVLGTAQARYQLDDGQFELGLYGDPIACALKIDGKISQLPEWNECIWYKCEAAYAIPKGNALFGEDAVRISMTGCDA